LREANIRLKQNYGQADTEGRSLARPLRGYPMNSLIDRIMDCPLPHTNRHRFRSACCLALALTCVGAAAATADDQRIFTKDHTFYIPYTVEAEPSGAEPSQIELHVSGDRGNQWQLYASQPPSSDHRFAFRAGVDGEFWFAVRTISAAGQPDKAQVESPELIVVVDQTPPKINLTATANEKRIVALHWSIDDAGLSPDSIEIQYRSSPDDTWMPIPPTKSTPNAYGDEIQGSASWVAVGDGAAVEVQVKAEDRAGNTSLVERAIPLSSNVAVNANPGAMSPDIPWPSSEPMGDQPTEGWRPSAGLPSDLMPPNGPVGNMLPPVSSSSPLPGQMFNQGQQAVPPMASRNERVSRSQRFQLEYEIEGVDSVAVHRVEIWATNDNGQTWRHLGDDDDKQSPYLVSVPNDGMYGFRLLVQAQEGLPVRPPLNGDMPDVWVRVDSSKPLVRLTNARYGRGADLGQLLLTWQATDQDLTDSPVTLLFGESPEGPWRIAAEGLPNSGSYQWPVDDRIPAELYLRIEVLDRAGNMGSDTSRTPIRADGLLPKGTIRAVTPAAHVMPNSHDAPVAPKSFTHRMRDKIRM
jgi:hypothetical protein